jgi:Na+-transporting NADH:ubiquinone oxidoreductase subunit A
MIQKLFFAGGKKFNFKGKPINKTIKIKTCKTLIIELNSEKFIWTDVLVKKNITYPAFTPVLSSSSIDEDEIVLYLPYTLKVSEIVETKFIKFEILGKEEKYPDSWSLFDRWINSGLWLGFENLLTNSVINPFIKPERLFVSTFNTEPFLRNLYINYKSGDLKKVLDAFFKVFKKIPVTFITDNSNKEFNHDLKNLEKNKSYNIDIFVQKNKYPSHHPAILLYKKIYPFKSVENSNKYWWTNFLSLKEFTNITTNKPILKTIVSLGGTTEGSHFEVPLYTPVSQIITSLNENEKIIRGGLLTGSELISHENHSINPGDQGFNIIKIPSTRKFIPFLNPEFHGDSYSPLVASWYLPHKKRDLHCGLRGEPRFCISCNYCEEVCPVGLDPQLLWKLTKENLIDEALKFGLKRCTGCGLCSYVCPSKIDISNILKTSRDITNEIT